MAVVCVVFACRVLVQSLPVVRPWASYSTSLCLVFLFYKMGTVTVPSSECCWVEGLKETMAIKSLAQFLALRNIQETGGEKELSQDPA